LFNLLEKCQKVVTFSSNLLEKLERLSQKCHKLKIFCPNLVEIEKMCYFFVKFVGKMRKIESKVPEIEDLLSKFVIFSSNLLEKLERLSQK